MDALVEQLMGSPKLPEIVTELQTRLEQERARRNKFYAEITEGQKAEYINGRVILQSPAKLQHLKVRDRLHRLLEAYTEVRGLGLVVGEKALCVFPRNDYEPDVCFFGPAKKAQLDSRTLKFPPPDFIAEVISESTEAIDRDEKFQDYQAHGVGEYWIIDPVAEVLEQYVLHGDKYHLAQKSGSGEVRSVLVQGFVIPIRAIFDAALNLNVLRQLIAR